MCYIEIVFIKNSELNVDQKSISPLVPIDQFITELLHLHSLMFANFDYQLSFPFLIQTPSSPVTDVTPKGPLLEDRDECFDCRSLPSSIGTPPQQRAKSVRRLNLSPADEQQKSASQESPSSMRKHQSNQGETPSSSHKRRKSPGADKPQRLLEDTPSASQKTTRSPSSSMLKPETASETSSNKPEESPTQQEEMTRMVCWSGSWL